MLSGYVRLVRTKDALNLFDELHEKDMFSWNSLVFGFSRRENLGICLELFFRMRFDMGSKHNEVTVIPVLSACFTGCSRQKFLSSWPWK